MLNSLSALANSKPYFSSTLKIEEARDFTLTQYAGSEKDLKKAFGKLPAIGKAQEGLLRISPTQVLLLDRHSGESGNLFETPLSSSRIRIAISGAPARELLAKCAAIDFHKTEFKLGHFAMTGIHHVPVLILCVEQNTFHIYVMRTFALSIYDYITDAALEYA